MTIIKVLDTDGEVFTTAVIGDDAFALRMLERFKLANTRSRFTFSIENVVQDLSLEDIVTVVAAANEGGE